MLHNCLSAMKDDGEERDENKPYCRSPQADSTEASEVATVAMRMGSKSVSNLIEHAKEVLRQCRRTPIVKDRCQPVAKSNKRQSMPANAHSSQTADEQERFQLLLNLLEYDCKQHTLLMEVALELAATVRFNGERNDLLVEYLMKMAEHRVTTAEGHSISSRSYLLLKVLAQSVHIERLAQAPEQVHSEIQEMKAAVRLLVGNLLQSMPAKGVKEFLGRLVVDSFTVANSKQFPLAVILLTIMQSELTQLIGVGGLDTDRAGCLFLLGQMMHRCILNTSHLPAVSYEVLQNSTEECDVCHNSCDLAMKFIIERTTVHEFVVCRECCLVSPKSRNVAKLLVNLLPLVLGNYSSNFEKEQVRQSKVLLVAHFADDFVGEREKFLAVVNYLEKSPIKVVAADISEQCLAYFNAFSERVGLVYQFRRLFQCWTVELECDNYLRRIKALKEVPQLLELYRPRNYEHDLDGYKDKLEEALSIRCTDINENVRLEALRAVIKVHSKSFASELKSLVVDRLSDSDHRVRNLALSFIEEHSAAIFSEPVSYCTAVLKLIELTLDIYGSIRQRAGKCMRLLLLSKKRDLKELQDNISSLLESPAVKNNRQCLKVIVATLLESDDSDNQISRLVEALLGAASINEGKILFARLLAQRYKQVLLKHLDSFLEMEQGGLTLHGEHLYSSILTILNSMLDHKSKYTSKQRGSLERLLHTVQENVFSQGEEVSKASLPLLVKLSLLFERQHELKVTLSKCLGLLQNSRSSEQLSPADIANLYRSMLIVTMGSIHLHRLTRDQQLVSSYESILWWVDNCPVKEVREYALEALCLFWQYDHKFLYFSEEAVARVLPFIEDERSILLVYRCFEATLCDLIERRSNAPIIGVVECLFVKTCRRFANSRDAVTRHLIIRLIDQFLRIGNSNPMEFVRYVMAYLCDPEVEVRQVACAIASRLEPRFMLSNFKESMAFVAEAIQQYYGEIEVATEGRCFFAVLIEDSNHKSSSRKTLPGKQQANRITFSKKLGELLTNCECLCYPCDQPLLQMCCSIIDASAEFERYDYIELLNSLHTKIEQNYYKLVKMLKRIVREGCEDNEEEPAIKQSYIMYRLLYTLGRLTGGKNCKTRIAEIESHSSSYLTIPEYPERRLDMSSDAEQLYHNIESMHEDTHCTKPKKIPFSSYLKNASKSKSKSRPRTHLKSAPKMSLSAALCDLSADKEENVSEYRAKLRRRNKPPA